MHIMHTLNDLRARLAYALVALGGRIHHEARVDYDAEFAAGYRLGRKAATR